MEQGGSPEQKESLGTRVEFPHLQLPSDIFSHLEKRYCIPEVSQIKTAIIRILSQRKEWTVCQFITEIHQRSLQSAFSMRVILLYTVVLVIRSIFVQYSHIEKTMKESIFFIRVNNSQDFRLASVHIFLPKPGKTIEQSRKIYLPSKLEDIGIQVSIQKGNKAAVFFKNGFFGQLSMPSVMLVKLTSKMAIIQFAYRYREKAGKQMRENYLTLEDFMHLGRYLRCGYLAGVELQLQKLLTALQQSILNFNNRVILFSNQSIFISSFAQKVVVNALTQIITYNDISLDYFNNIYADRSILIKKNHNSASAENYSIGIIFLEAIALKYGIQWFKKDLERNLGIWARTSILQQFIQYIQEEKYFTDNASLAKLRQWLHLGGDNLKNHPFFDYSGEIQKAIISIQQQEGKYITPRLNSLISHNQINILNLSILSNVLIALGFSDVKLDQYGCQQCPRCYEHRSIKTYCNHRLCINCYLLDLQLGANGKNGWRGPQCQNKGCNQRISVHQLLSLLFDGTNSNSSIKLLLSRLLAESPCNLIPQYCYCIRDIQQYGDQQIYFFQKKGILFFCRCGDSKCTSCLMLFHLPLTCIEFKQHQQCIQQQTERYMRQHELLQSIQQISKALKSAAHLELIKKIPLLIREWIRMHLCCTLKSPKSQLGGFFLDLASYTYKVIAQLINVSFSAEKQMFQELLTLIGLRNTFLLSMLL